MHTEEDTDDERRDEPVAVDVESPSGESSSRDTKPATAMATTPREEAALRRVRWLTRLLDEAVRIPGTNYRIGLDPLLGIAPVGGDAIATVLSLYPIFEAYRFGASRGTLAKMGVLVAIDAVVGSIPVLGTVFDAVWKANEWNRRSLERLIESE